MLVLSRKKNEQIVVVGADGQATTITIVEIRGDKTRLGMDAPPSVQIHRREVWERIKREQKRAEEQRSGGAEGIQANDSPNTFNAEAA